MRLLIVTISWLISMEASSAQDVRVDRQGMRAEVTVEMPEGRLIVSLDPFTNLVSHTVNLYDMNRQSGAKHYSLRNDEAARKAVVPELYAELAGNDHYFNRRSEKRWYEPTMEAIVDCRSGFRVGQSPRTRHP